MTNIFQLSITPFTAWLLASWTQGLSVSMKAAPIIMAIQCGLFAAVLLPLPSRAKWFQPLAMVGSVFSGATSAMFQGSASHLSAAFFVDDRSRARSTSIGMAGQYTGMCLSQLWFQAIDTEHQFQLLLIIYFAMAGGLALGSALFFPDPPVSTRKTDEAMHLLPNDNAVAATQRLGFYGGIKLCVTDVTVMLLVISGGIAQGISFSFVSTLPMAFAGIEDNGLGYHFTSRDGDVFAFATLLAYCITSTISGDVCERWFHTRHRLYLIIVQVLAILTCSVLFVMISSTFREKIGLDLSDPAVCYWSVCAAVVSIGLTTGLILPPLLEMLAEASYPAPEVTSGSAVFVITELMCMPIPAIIPIVGPQRALQLSTGMLLIASAVCVLLTLPVKNAYKRRQAQEYGLSAAVNRYE